MIGFYFGPDGLELPRGFSLENPTLEVRAVQRSQKSTAGIFLASKRRSAGKAGAIVLSPTNFHYFFFAKGKRSTLCGILCHTLSSASVVFQRRYASSIVYGLAEPPPPKIRPSGKTKYIYPDSNE